jgi:hypothetical protein
VSGDELLHDNHRKEIIMVDKTKVLSDAEVHEAVMEDSLGNMTSRLSDSSPDMGLAIDIWILKEFRAWVRKKFRKSTFSPESVKAIKYWEKNVDVKYEVKFTYTGEAKDTVKADEDVDASVSHGVTMHIIVRNGCGPAIAPTLLVLELIILTEVGPTKVHNSFGTILLDKDEKGQIVGTADGHCGR